LKKKTAAAAATGITSCFQHQPDESTTNNKTQTTPCGGDCFSSHIFAFRSSSWTSTAGKEKQKK